MGRAAVSVLAFGLYMLGQGALPGRGLPARRPNLARDRAEHARGDHSAADAASCVAGGLAL
jgi:hypothetical protein